MRKRTEAASVAVLAAVACGLGVLESERSAASGGAVRVFLGTSGAKIADVAHVYITVTRISVQRGEPGDDCESDDESDDDSDRSDNMDHRKQRDAGHGRQHRDCRPDGGVVDAGIPDAGLDGGVTDAGITDAGIEDGGIIEDGGVLGDGGILGDGGVLGDGGILGDGGVVAPAVTVLCDQPQVIDLMALAQDRTTLLCGGQAISVPPGRVSQVRLLVSAASIVFNNGSSAPLIIRSASETGLKINFDAEVSAGGTLAIQLQFDVARSIQHTSLGWELRPVIRATRRDF